MAEFQKSGCRIRRCRRCKRSATESLEFSYDVGIITWPRFSSTKFGCSIPCAMDSAHAGGGGLDPPRRRRRSPVTRVISSRKTRFSSPTMQRASPRHRQDLVPEPPWPPSETLQLAEPALQKRLPFHADGASRSSTATASLRQRPKVATQLVSVPHGSI